MLKGKTIVVGVTGGIAAYKAAQLCSDLVKKEAEVHVIMTRNATEFISPMTFEVLTSNKVAVDTFDRSFEYNVEHVSLAKKADLFVIAPATANVIAKMAHGLADDMLTTTVLAARCPKLIAPAMNTGMYENPVTQKNFEILQELGVEFIDADIGYLACGDMGKGRLAEPAAILDKIEAMLTMPKDLLGLKLLVTAGPTCEALDPVRYLTNNSSGKMGYELARAAQRRGAEVTLVSGEVSLAPPRGINLVKIRSAQEMYDQVMARAEDMDMIIKAAAVADYRPGTISDHKIKKAGDDLTLTLVRNPDILKALGEQKREGQILCGFSMETKDLLENSTAKLKNKNADMMVANHLFEEGAGFKGDTNVAAIITKQAVEQLGIMSKFELANVILTKLLAIRGLRADEEE